MVRLFGGGNDKPRAGRNQRQPKSVEIEFLEAGGGEGYVLRTCPVYVCRNLPSFASLLEVVRSKAAEHPNERILATLDEYGQASYTSGHARDKDQLEWIDDDTPFAPTRDDRTTPEDARRLFDLVRRNILAQAEGRTFADLAGRLRWGHPDALPFDELHARPDELLDPREHHLMLAPVQHGWEAIAAFPNGYFAGDLQPADNLVLARHFEETYGYLLFGIGASYIGFLRDQPLAPSAARAMAADILSLHDLSLFGSFDSAVELEKVATALQTYDWMLFFYSGR
jgi:hypothetical protein